MCCDFLVSSNKFCSVYASCDECFSLPAWPTTTHPTIRYCYVIHRVSRRLTVDERSSKRFAVIITFIKSNKNPPVLHQMLQILCYVVIICSNVTYFCRYLNVWSPTTDVRWFNSTCSKSSTRRKNSDIKINNRILYISTNK